MSWGTYYQYNGYLSHIGKNEIDSKREECNSVNDMLWREILAYMASTPPATAKDRDSRHQGRLRILSRPKGVLRPFRRQYASWNSRGE